MTTLLERITRSVQKLSARYNYANDSVAGSGYGNWIKCGHCNNGFYMRVCVCVRGGGGAVCQHYVHLLMQHLKNINNPVESL